MALSLTSSASLFVPQATSPVGDSAGWLASVLTGSVATALCVLAIAFVGLLMLSGRIVLGDALRVVLGCFILLGAPVIASAFLSVAPRGPGAVVIEPLPEQEIDAREELPPADYNPYAGASLRQD